jgi:hypothetical protein
MTKPILIRATLEGTAAFALGGLALEWLHPGLVTYVVPWAAVAGVALALAGILAWLEPRRQAGLKIGRSVWPMMATALTTALTGLAAYAFFAAIPRFQPVLAAAVTIIVALGAVTLTTETE